MWQALSSEQERMLQSGVQALGQQLQSNAQDLNGLASSLSHEAQQALEVVQASQRDLQTRMEGGAAVSMERASTMVAWMADSSGQATSKGLPALQQCFTAQEGLLAVYTKVGRQKAWWELLVGASAWGWGVRYGWGVVRVRCGMGGA